MTLEQFGRRRAGGVLSAREVELAARNGRTLVLPASTLITPAARDRARELGVTIQLQREVAPLAPPTAAVTTLPGSYDLIEPLAAFVLAAASNELPPGVIETTKVLLLDSIAVGYAGTLAEGVRAVIAGLSARRQAERGHVIGQRQKLPPPEAALCNGALIHSLEFDSAFDEGLIHPMAGVVPAALALADELRLSRGLPLLTAIAVGGEIACRISYAATGTPPFYRCGAMAAFGGVAAAGVLLDLDQDALVRAFGIAYHQAVMPWLAHEEGSPIHGALPGFGAHAAVVAARLAAGGASGPRRVLEGEAGYFRACEGGAWDRARALDGLGASWLLQAISLKPYPSGRLTHGAIDGVLQLRAAHGLRPEQVRQITIAASQIIAHRTGRKPEPSASLVNQRLSVPFVVAQALRRGAVGLDCFGPAEVAHPEVQALMERVQVVAAPDIPPTDLAPVRVCIETVEGARLETEVRQLLGSPARPLSREERLAKLAHCWQVSGQPAYRRPARLAETIEHLDEANSLAAFWAAVAPQATP
ncbi:MAG: MmgE/PrpD family protein [Chloroflexi bacterium]|nr:MmgE/PrpD family protein [Chloroflexota bacterium]